MYAMNGRKALVTGGAQGIGAAIAERLVAEGCDVAIVDLDGDGADARAKALAASGARAVAAQGDVTDPASVAAFTATLTGALGGLDILVNNAGICELAPLGETDPAAVRRTFDVNVHGMLLCTQAALPALRDSGAGRIVNVASWMAKQGVENYGAYCASKAAVVSMTQTLALEVAVSGITVNAVCPGLVVDTRMREESDAERARRGMPLARKRAHTIPLGRVGYPADVAKVAVFLASAEADYVTGAAINVTGGLWMN
jgi:NAD(P)-dependent dehydrogenase (short-subunit alcohol dehydrogenase family)